MDRILLVEDDARLGQQVVDSLREAGMDVTWIDRGDDALSADPGVYDLAILDLMLPGAYGLDVLKHLRRRSDLPVLILSARTEASDKVRSLELGADDFVTKPFWPEELLARVQARLRRPTLVRDGTHALGGVTLDLDGRRALRDGHTIEFTRVEFDLLAYLVKQNGAAVTRQELVDHCLDPERDGSVRTLDVHVSRLRKKLGDEGAWVKTVWGIGYRIEDPA